MLWNLLILKLSDFNHFSQMELLPRNVSGVNDYFRWFCGITILILMILEIFLEVSSMVVNFL